ncbi:MAG: hypothetical protein COB50_03990 [Thiotrichales bacterium]|nr:MAG: hypothetical protein COB50_03990 [Thiotrichales bacterium]
MEDKYIENIASGKVKSVDLEGDECFDAKALTEAIKSANCRLERIRFYGTDYYVPESLSQALASYIRNQTFRITHISFHYYGLPANIFAAIIDYLKNPLCGLQQLNLYSTGISDADVEKIYLSLKNSKCELHTIILGDNNISDASVTLLADLVEDENHSLAEVSCFNSKVSDELGSYLNDLSSWKRNIQPFLLANQMRNTNLINICGRDPVMIIYDYLSRNKKQAFRKELLSVNANEGPIKPIHYNEKKRNLKHEKQNKKRRREVPEDHAKL